MDWTCGCRSEQHEMLTRHTLCKINVLLTHSIVQHNELTLVELFHTYNYYITTSHDAHIELGLLHNQCICHILHIRHKINCLHTLKRKSLKHPSETNKLEVKHLEDELQQIITAAKLDYKSHLVYNFVYTNNNKIFFQVYFFNSWTI